MIQTNYKKRLKELNISYQLLLNNYKLYPKNSKRWSYVNLACHMNKITPHFENQLKTLLNEVVKNKEISTT